MRASVRGLSEAHRDWPRSIGSARRPEPASFAGMTVGARLDPRWAQDEAAVRVSLRQYSAATNREPRLLNVVLPWQPGRVRTRAPLPARKIV
jgi:hypothetical protein